MYIFMFVVIGIALVFEFTNGFHDTANAVATSISTKSMEPKQAISIAAIFNLIGALSGTAVAITIIKGFADPNISGLHVIILVALLSAITWNLFTWYLGMPSSSSHALIGGLIGGVIFKASYQQVHYLTLVYKVLIPMVVSPMLGFIFAIIIFMLINRIVSNKMNPRKTNSFIREAQILSTAFLAFGHGSNDSQKTMGILTLTLYSFGVIHTIAVPFWVIILCACTMSLGTFMGGVKIIKTLSTRVSKLQPSQGLAAEIGCGIVLFLGSHLGIPISTTHVISGSIMGAGSTQLQAGSVNLNVVKDMIIAWVLTIPCCIMLAGFFIFIIQHIV